MTTCIRRQQQAASAQDIRLGHAGFRIASASWTVAKTHASGQHGHVFAMDALSESMLLLHGTISSCRSLLRLLKGRHQ